jgi:hypothetical protein
MGRKRPVRRREKRSSSPTPIIIIAALLAAGIFSVLTLRGLRHDRRQAESAGTSEHGAAHASTSRVLPLPASALPLSAGASGVAREPILEGEAPRALGYVPASDVRPPPRDEPIVVPRPAEPPDPLVGPPPSDNPGGVDGDRPARSVAGLD